MPVSNPNKTVSQEVLHCGDLTTLTLSFEAEPELKTAPADMVLMMDRSGSMGGSPMAQAKIAAKQLIQTVAQASGSAAGDAIENGSRLGIISFSDTVTENAPLTGDVTVLTAAVDSLTAGGSTNHAAAFAAAGDLLKDSTSQRRIVIMFTDGNTNVGPDPAIEAEAMKSQGIEIYCIGLLQDAAPLLQWASDPEDTHVAVTDDVSQLQKVFAEAAAEVVLAGALEASIREVLHPDFKIVRVDAPTHGTVDVVDPQTLEWTAGAVGVNGRERAELTLDVMYTGSASGKQTVNASILYQDRQGNALNFPDPQVELVCDSAAVYPEACPLPATFRVDGCRDTAVVQANDTVISGLGRIVQVDAVIKHVCPDKRVAVAVILTELDETGVEHDVGCKSFLIPPQGGEECRDVQIRCISFVVPEALAASGVTDSICGARGFRTRVLANYVDTDFVCCDSETVIR